ncbi:MAG TPA: response regulator [Caulobacteraceae bacterium]
MTVLLIEDDPLIRMIAAELLMDLGHTVTEAENAEEALTALQGGSVDVLITDLGLPGVSGADIAAMARELSPNLGIVFATGSAHAPPILGGGAPAYLLSKPYDGAGLAAALRAVQAPSD